MCWLAVRASHSNGLSHLQGRQAHSLTLCVPLSSRSASHTAAAMGGSQKKEKEGKMTQEQRSARRELRRGGGEGLRGFSLFLAQHY